MPGNFTTLLHLNCKESPGSQKKHHMNCRFYLFAGLKTSVTKDFKMLLMNTNFMAVCKKILVVFLILIVNYS